MVKIELTWARGWGQSSEGETCVIRGCTAMKLTLERVTAIFFPLSFLSVFNPRVELTTESA